MENTIIENAKKYFEEEMSGEPLTQDVVIEGLVEFAISVNKFVTNSVNNWNKNSNGNMKFYIETVELPDESGYLSKVDWSKADGGKIGTPGCVRYGSTKEESCKRLKDKLTKAGHTVLTDAEEVKTDMKFQRKLLKKLRGQEKFAYEEASIYTVLLDLVEGNGADDVFQVLKDVTRGLGEN